MDERGAPIALRGRLREPGSLAALGARIEQETGRSPLLLPGGPDPLRSIGICSGGAARGIRVAAELGLDVWLTGEPSEDSRALAAELGISFIAAGHYATETLGVQAARPGARRTALRRRDDLRRRREPCVKVSLTSLPFVRSFD